MAPSHILLLMLVNMVWGLNFVAAKVGVTYIPPLLFTACRFMMVAAILLPFVRLRRLPFVDIAIIAVSAGALHFGLMYWGVRLANASIAAVILQLSVPFSALLSIIVLGERVGWRRWLGIGMAMCGVAFLSFDNRMLDLRIGTLVLICAAMSMGLAQIFMRRVRGVGVFELQAWIAIISVPCLLLGSAGLEKNALADLRAAPWIAWGGVVYTALGASIIGHGGLYFLLQRYEVSMVTPMTLAAPLLGVIFAVMLLGESFSLQMVIGGTVTLLGVALIALRQQRLSPPEGTILASDPMKDTQRSTVKLD